MAIEQNECDSVRNNESSMKQAATASEYSHSSMEFFLVLYMRAVLAVPLMVDEFFGLLYVNICFIIRLVEQWHIGKMRRKKGQRRKKTEGWQKTPKFDEDLWASNFTAPPEQTDDSMSPEFCAISPNPAPFRGEPGLALRILKSYRRLDCRSLFLGFRYSVACCMELSEPRNDLCRMMGNLVVILAYVRYLVILYALRPLESTYMRYSRRGKFDRCQSTLQGSYYNLVSGGILIFQIIPPSS